MNKQSGFTLVELIVVIIILGILSATALPKFMDISGDASQSAVKGVAGSVSSWGVMNYSAVKMGKTTPDAFPITDATDACIGAANSLIKANTDANAVNKPIIAGITLQTAAAANTDQFVVTGGTPKICAVGVTIQCQIAHKNGQTAIAYIPCTN